MDVESNNYIEPRSNVKEFINNFIKPLILVLFMWITIIFVLLCLCFVCLSFGSLLLNEGLKIF